MVLTVLEYLEQIGINIRGVVTDGQEHHNTIHRPGSRDKRSSEED